MIQGPQGHEGRIARQVGRSVGAGTLAAFDGLMNQGILRDQARVDARDIIAGRRVAFPPGGFRDLARDALHETPCPVHRIVQGRVLIEFDVIVLLPFTQNDLADDIVLVVEAGRPGLPDHPVQRNLDLAAFLFREAAADIAVEPREPHLLGVLGSLWRGKGIAAIDLAGCPRFGPEHGALLVDRKSMAHPLDAGIAMRERVGLQLQPAVAGLDHRGDRIEETEQLDRGAVVVEHPLVNAHAGERRGVSSA